MRILIGMAFATCLLTASAESQGVPRLPAVKYTRVAILDSVDVWGPALSPDGRWIAYSGRIEGESARNLWIIPASGGTSRRLTTGNYDERVPVWFPSSDRILFRSTRAGGALMTIRIDPAAGRPAGAPQRLSLDVPSDQYEVSPDGKWVVYTNVNSATTPGVLRIIPASGGRSRTLDSMALGRGGFHSPDFTADGRYVEYLYHEGSGTPSVERLQRVSLSGGKPIVLLDPVRQWLRYGKGIVAHVPRDADSVWLRNTRGDTIAAFSVENRATRNPYRYFRFTSKPNTFLAVAGLGATQVHVVGVEGGTPRVVGPPQGYIDGFTAAGDVMVEVPVKNRTAIEIHPVAGGATRRIVLPDSLSILDATTDAALVYWRQGATLGVFDVAAGKSRIISRAFALWGDEYRSSLGSSDEARYVERHNGRLELRAWLPSAGTSRLVRSITGGARMTVSEYVGRGQTDVYSIAMNDSIMICVSEGPRSSVRRLFAMRGSHTDGLSLSQDGKRLAFGASIVNGKDTTHAIGFVDLHGAAGPPRLVPVPEMTGVAWLPNTNDVVYVDMGGGRTHVMRLADAEGATPRSVTQSERLLFWDHVISPDGKWIGYPVDLPSRSEIWRVEIPGLESRLVRR